MAAYQKQTISPALLAEPEIKLRKITQKTRYRMQQIARMTADGVPDSEIMMLLGYKSTQSVMVLRASPEYKVIAYGLEKQFSTEYDLQAASSVKELKEDLRNRIPDALRVLYDALQDKKIDNRLKAADRIIELDGRLTKKAGDSQVNIFNLSEADMSIGDAIAQSLAGKKS